jgi:hypothetical protein
LIVAEKNATKNILDGRKDGQMDRGKTVYPLPPPGSGGIIKIETKNIIKKCILYIRNISYGYLIKL